jgi:hypothetical protein
MPRKIEVTVYKFNELKSRAKEKARDWYREGALDYEWWDGTYEDAKNIGLKITAFDLDRRLGAEGKFTDGALDVAAAILKDHGNECETYKDARDFIKEWEKKEKAFLEADEDNTEDDFRDSEDGEELEKEFLNTLLQDYAQILQKEYEYLMSDEQVDESIMANEYEFDEDGNRV